MFEPRVALASLSGESDADWARAGSDHAGAAFLGGVALDEATRDAAREMVERDREEFLPPDPAAFVEAQLDALADAPIRPGVNVRSATVEPIVEIARSCANRDAIVEINAHCRQEEMCDAGCGEALLRDADRLCEYVAAASDAGADVSVKVRAEVSGVDLAETARRVAAAGADAIHVDAMDAEPVVADVAEQSSAGCRTQSGNGGTPTESRAAGGAGDVADAAPSLFVIANNEVRGRESVREYLRHGADAVSVGRPSTDERVRGRVRRAVDEWFAEAASDPTADSR